MTAVPPRPAAHGARRGRVLRPDVAWLGVLVAFAASPAAVAAQRFDAAQADSAAAVERARSAQGRFERERVRRIPLDRWGFSGGGCDERVGRMCLRLEGGSDWWWPEEEAPELTAARARLIEQLAEAARTAPGDPWILGQRVVYLGEAGRWAEAERLASRCGIRAEERWWCDALEGLALHVQGDYVVAAERFRAALASMEPDRALEWREVGDLLTSEGDDARDRAVERGDSAAVDRFWALSDPLFLVPGNDRWTEHMARRTWSRTREGARNAYSMSWGSDLDELLVRYGWEVGWERRDPGASIGVSTSA
ncbi:MAG: hypothetical protein HKO98_14000, partial [Gemmatimonadetes bacterium]|nr:hypothetical protein [Gemmatimonadota bacterium]